jgi:hypothetical protein
MDIGNSVEQGFDTFFQWLPNLVGALVILLVGWIVARVVKSICVRGLRKLGFDRQMTRGRFGEQVTRVVHDPSELIGVVAYWLVLLGTFSLAVTALGIDALTAFVASIYAYLPHVLAALLIFVVAAAISGAVAAFTSRVMGDTPTGKVVATVAPILIMTIASFMILTELMIAEEIVLITYACLMGAIALGSALAFGLGGRQAASRLLDTAVEKGREQQGQVKRDLQEGRTNTKRFVREQDLTDEQAPTEVVDSTAFRDPGY